MKTQSPVQLGYLDLTVTQIWVEVGAGNGTRDWVLDTTGTVDSHDPMDRVGGPFRISDYVESEGDKWFLFAVVDCAFPLHDLVRGDSFPEAYEQYIDWAADHRHITIGEADYGDYGMDTDAPTCSFTSDGKPVDTDNIQGREVRLHRLVV